MTEKERELKKKKKSEYLGETQARQLQCKPKTNMASSCHFVFLLLLFLAAVPFQYLHPS